MKNKLLRIVTTLALGALLLAYFGCEKKGTETFRDEKGGIFVWKDIDSVKWDKIKEVLGRDSGPGASRRSELYRLRKYNPGSTPENAGDGTLCDAMLIRTIAEVDEHAAQTNFKGFAVQIGLGALADYQVQEAGDDKSRPGGKKETPTPTPTAEFERLMPHAHLPENIIESQKMVEEVNAVLDGTADTNSR